MPDEANPIDFPKAYDPKQWESVILARWAEADFANPDTCIAAGVTKADAEPFSVLMPPPNVTGVLHLGHALENALLDTFVRYKRMCGYRTLFLPGTDHAAIATESKVRKLLFEQEGKSRQDLGRTEFLKRVEQFAIESHDTIVGQVKRLGSSADWSREAYTLDSARNLAVRTAFKQMYDAGIIYRGNRIVNWDPVGQTTISDDEIVYREETAKLYYLKYGPFEIATARPETKFGDKYVVMHPSDPRYAEYADGQKLTVEWINGPIEATVVKDEAIDMGFGTGVMTITPWHSTVDFELAERHGLDMEPIIDLEGKLLPIAGIFSGLPITEAREQIVAKLESKGLVTKIDDTYVHKVATAERTKAVVEPQVMRQWFVGVNREFEPARNASRNDAGGREGKMVTLKSLMQAAVRTKEVTILPERFEKNYFYWIDNLRDWCISRQLWFGHRIPVWYRGNETYCGIDAPTGDGWQQDPDTLDTWFSSGLWTFSTLGWPNSESSDLKTYHPVSWMTMGYEILFFWMARMILMTTYAVGTIPFKNVYIHGMLRDKNGQKFSKSLGNGIDPLDVGAEYGTDALRLALLSDITPGNDSRFSLDKVESARNFVNKLWNIGRYVSLTPSEENPVLTSPADHWIQARLDTTLRSVETLMEKQNLSLAIATLHDFTWNDFADWYVEIHKAEQNHALLNHVYRVLLKAWHPFTPFVTEGLASKFSPTGPLLMVSQYPSPASGTVAAFDTSIATSFERVIELIQKIRNLRVLYRIDPKEKLSLTLVGDEATLTPFTPIIERLGRISEVLITDESSARPSASASLTVGTLRAFVSLGDTIDIAAEKSRLEKECAELDHYAAGLEKRLADPRFTEKAPANIIDSQRQTLTETRAKISVLTAALQEIST